MTSFPRNGLFVPVEGGAWAATNAVLTGDLSFGQDATIWFGCVLRGDDAPLIVGRRTNIQDLTMMHADPGVANVLGEEVIRFREYSLASASEPPAAPIH